MSRTRERALRIALGAGRVQIARQWLMEAVSFIVPGSVLGVGLAWLAVAGLRAAGPAGVPRVAEIGINGSVLLFAIVASTVTALVAALIPACVGAREALVPALREGERGMAGGRRARRLRGVLVGAEIAASLVALIAAGLLTRSFEQMLVVDRGLQVDHRLTFTAGLSAPYFSERRTWPFVNDLLRRVQGLPGVVSAAAVNSLPLTPGSVGMGVAVPGAAMRDADVPWATWRVVTPDYFKTLGVPLLAGRALDEADAASAIWRVVISRRLATLLWPGQDPIGHTMLLWKGQGDRPAEVIGVVGDMRERGLTSDPTLAVYFNRQVTSPLAAPLAFVVHTRGAEAALVAPIRTAVAALDPEVPLSDVRTLEDILSDSIASSRLTMATSATVGLVAFLLALVGIQGVLAHSVARRTSELGLRVALGATGRRVLGLVLIEGMRPVLIGAGIGIAAAFAMARLMESLLFGITPTDPATYAGVFLLLTAAATIVCAFPACRASRVNVVTALRNE